jgi:hypothetical protein
MKPDDFEQQLRNLPLRPVPPDWRAEMLIVARVAGQEARSSEREVSVPWWRVWLWPCPQAWAGLAAVWVLLIGLHWGTPSPTDGAQKSGGGATEQLAGLAAQRRELTRLLDVPLDLAPAAPESSVKPTPRSMAEPRSNPRAEIFSGRVLVAADFPACRMCGVRGHLSSLPKCAGSETGAPVQV